MGCGRSAPAPGDDAELPEEPGSPEFDGKAEANQVSGSPVPGSTQSPQDTAKRKSQHDNFAAATPGGRTLQSFVPDTLLTWLAEKAAARVPSASFCPAKEHLSAAVAFVDIRHES